MTYRSRDDRLAAATETVAWCLTGERRYLDDPVYGVVPPVTWLRRQHRAWLVERRPCK